MNNVSIENCARNLDSCLCWRCLDECSIKYIQCKECKEGVNLHNIYMCTEFTGVYPSGITSEEVHERAVKLLEDHKKK